MMKRKSDDCVDVERKVKAVIQVAGLHSLVRIDPVNEGRREWFKRASHSNPKPAK